MNKSPDFQGKASSFIEQFECMDQAINPFVTGLPFCPGTQVLCFSDLNQLLLEYLACYSLFLNMRYMQACD